MVGSQTASLTPRPSFIHNLCFRCPNGSCEVILDIYASRPFQQYKQHFRARCFDPCHRALKFWESRRTPKSPFRERECHPHTPSKWGCDIYQLEFWDFIAISTPILASTNWNFGASLQYLHPYLPLPIGILGPNCNTCICTYFYQLRFGPSYNTCI
jgi:hypothetical protein